MRGLQRATKCALQWVFREGSSVHTVARSHLLELARDWSKAALPNKWPPPAHCPLIGCANTKFCFLFSSCTAVAETGQANYVVGLSLASCEKTTLFSLKELALGYSLSSIPDKQDICLTKKKEGKFRTTVM